MTGTLWAPRRARRAAALIAATVAVILVALTATTLAGHRAATHPAATTPTGVVHHRPARTGPTAPAATAGAFLAVPPLTANVPDTPAQQSTDRQLASGLAASGTVQEAEAATVPAPGYVGGWRPLPVIDSPDAWAVRFVSALLDIRFATQTRAGLGRWLSAESAPELLPGVPPSVQDKLTYLSLFDSRAVGGGPSPVPSPDGWRRAASSGTVWHAADLLVQPDPAWARLVATGWQPVDERFAAEDVSGLLVVTAGGHRTDHHFSLELYVGSAHWHPGYGSVVVTAWKES